MRTVEHCSHCQLTFVVIHCLNCSAFSYSSFMHRITIMTSEVGQHPLPRGSWGEWMDPWATQHSLCKQRKKDPTQNTIQAALPERQAHTASSHLQFGMHCCLRAHPGVDVTSRSRHKDPSPSHQLRVPFLDPFAISPLRCSIADQQCHLLASASNVYTWLRSLLPDRSFSLDQRLPLIAGREWIQHVRTGAHVLMAVGRVPVEYSRVSSFAVLIRE